MLGENCRGANVQLEILINTKRPQFSANSFQRSGKEIMFRLGSGEEAAGK
jgi:hypothetical protein